MFNFISKKIRSLIIDNNFIRKFILKTLSKNLYIPYEIYFIEKFNDEDKHLQMEYQNIEDEMMEDIVAFTCPYDESWLYKIQYQCNQKRYFRIELF